MIVIVWKLRVQLSEATSTMVRIKFHQSQLPIRGLDRRKLVRLVALIDKEPEFLVGRNDTTLLDNAKNQSNDLSLVKVDQIRNTKFRRSTNLSYLCFIMPLNMTSWSRLCNISNFYIEGREFGTASCTIGKNTRAATTYITCSAGRPNPALETPRSRSNHSRTLVNVGRLAHGSSSISSIYRPSSGDTADSYMALHNQDRSSLFTTDSIRFINRKEMSLNRKFHDPRMNEKYEHVYKEIY